MRKLIILLILLISSPAISQEAGYERISDFSKESNVILNDQMRRTIRRLRDIESGVSLTTGVSGVLPLANGGTGAALVDPDADRILFWDDSEGTVDLLTLGNLLSTTTTTLNVANPIMTLADSNETTSVTDTGDLTITSGLTSIFKFYLQCNATTDSQLILRFNNDSTGNDYKYWLREHDISANTDTESNSDGSTGIILTRTASNGFDNGTYIYGTLIITSRPGALGAHVSGHYYFAPQTPGGTFAEIDGYYEGGEITSIEIIADNALQIANTYLYEIEIQ